MIRLLFSCLFCASAWATCSLPNILIPAAQWYVDNTADGCGNDSNNGTSATTPVLTIAGLSAKSIQAGDTIAISCTNTIFREEFTVPQNNVKIVNYNCYSLPLPILDGSDVVSSGAWSKTGGLSNTYQAGSLPVEGLSNPSWVNAWDNGTQLAFAGASNTSTCTSAQVDATPGTYCPSSLSSSPITLYVHLSDNSNPGSNGRPITYTNRQTGITSYNVSGSYINGIVTQNSSSNNGSMVLGPGSTVLNSQANNGGKHNIYSWGTAYFNNVKVQNAYYNGQGSTMFVFNENVGAGENVRYSDVTVTTTPYDASVSGFYGHTNVSGSFGEIIFDTDSCTNVFPCFSANANGGIIYNAVMTGVGEAAQIAPNWIINGLSGTMLTGFGNYGVVCYGGLMQINNMTLGGVGGVRPHFGIFVEEGATNVQLYVTNSLIVNSAGALAGVYNDTALAPFFYFSGNTIANSQNIYMLQDAAGVGTTIYSDYNTFDSTMGYIAYLTSTATTYVKATWQALGYDLHSTF